MLSVEVFRGLASLHEHNLSKCWVTSLPTNILRLLLGIKRVALREGVKCWRIQKQEVFHRHVGQSEAEAALTCEVPGVI